MSLIAGNWKARTLLVLASAVLLWGVVGLTAARAATAITPGDGWHFFSFGGVGSGASGEPYTYSSTSITKVTVTDAFCEGDEFRVSNNAVVLGDTSSVATVACPGSGAADGDTALANPGYSSGVFLVAPGSNSITIEVTESPFGGGGAFLRVDEVVVTPEECKKGGWENFGGIFKNQGDCVAYVETQGTNEPGQNVPGAP